MCVDVMSVNRMTRLLFSYCETFCTASKRIKCIYLTDIFSMVIHLFIYFHAYTYISLIGIFLLHFFFNWNILFYEKIYIFLKLQFFIKATVYFIYMKAFKFKQVYYQLRR